MLSLYFSPRGTTETTARAITAGEPALTELDLLATPLQTDRVVSPQEPVLVTLPVYSGRIPGLCRDMLRTHLRGSGGPAAAVVVYGNREFDDALTELQDLLEEAGFRVVAAAAFVAQHSIFPATAAGRPDAQDRALMARFGAQCRETFAAFSPGAPHTPITVRGSHTYKTPGPARFHPSADQALCQKCGLCAQRCPAGAIPSDAPWQTREDLCIACGACIRACPHQARDFRGEAYLAAGQAFGAKCAARREPEFFF